MSSLPYVYGNLDIGRLWKHGLCRLFAVGDSISAKTELTKQAWWNPDKWIGVAGFTQDTLGRINVIQELAQAGLSWGSGTGAGPPQPPGVWTPPHGLGPNFLGSDGAIGFAANGGAVTNDGNSLRRGMIRTNWGFAGSDNYSRAQTWYGGDWVAAARANGAPLKWTSAVIVDPNTPPNLSIGATNASTSYYVGPTIVQPTPPASQGFLAQTITIPANMPDGFGAGASTYGFNFQWELPAGQSTLATQYIYQAAPSWCYADDTSGFDFFPVSYGGWSAASFVDTTLISDAVLEFVTQTYRRNAFSIALGQNELGNPNLGPDTAALVARLRRVMNLPSAPGVIFTPYYTSTDPSGADAAAQALYDVVQSDPNLLLVDIRQSFGPYAITWGPGDTTNGGDNNGGLSDGTHPNVKGRTALAQQMWTGIEIACGNWAVGRPPGFSSGRMR